MARFLVLTATSFSLVGFVLGVWADGWEQARQLVPILVITPLTFLGGSFYSISMLPDPWRDADPVQPGRLSDLRLPVELLWDRGRRRHDQPLIHARFLVLCMMLVAWIFNTGYRLN